MTPPGSAHSAELILEIDELKSKLAEAQEVIRAIQGGEVDAIVVSGPIGEQVFSLRGAEYAYRALIEAMNEGAATIAADGTVLYCNKRLADLLAIDLTEIIGQPILRFVSTSSRSRFEALFANALNGSSDKSELELCRAGLSPVPAYISVGRMAGASPASVALVITDLTEQKRWNDLVAAGNLARTILESAAEGIAVCDRDGQITIANDAFKKLCRTNPLFRPFNEVLPLQLEDGAGVQTDVFAVAEALNGGTSRPQEVVFQRSDGRKFALLLSAGAIEGPDGTAGYVLTLTDVTERKLAEKALRNSEKSAATGRLAASVAHEINNPLASIYNLLYLIGRDASLERIRNYVDTATAELGRVAHIVKQTLAFYRDSIKPESMNLIRVLDEVVEFYRKDLEASRISVEKAYRNDIEIIAYPGEIRQIFSNLIRNAFEAMPEGGRIRLRVTTSLKAARNGFLVFVSDTGPGIDRGRSVRIFEPFYTTKGEKGTGLGLWVVKNLIQRHGGSIRVRSKFSSESRGTSFCLFFPRDIGSKSHPARDSEFSKDSTRAEAANSF